MRSAVLLVGSVFLSTVAGPAIAAEFVRGDADGSTSITVSDPVRILDRLFAADPAPTSCEDAVDANDDGAIDLSDAVFLLTFLFRRGDLPRWPRFRCGEDPTPDALDCERYAPCEGARGRIFAIDRSMRAAEDEVVELAVEHVSRLDAGDLFAIVSFLRNEFTEFPESDELLRATPQNVAAALAWIRSRPSSRGLNNCARPGLLRCIQRAESSRLRWNVITYVGNGFLLCPGHNRDLYNVQTLEAVRAANVRRTPIDVVHLVRSEIRGVDFGRRLAEENNGILTRP